VISLTTYNKGYVNSFSSSFRVGGVAGKTSTFILSLANAFLKERAKILEIAF
jgi:hypothetical protein